MQGWVRHLSPADPTVSVPFAAGLNGPVALATDIDGSLLILCRNAWVRDGTPAANTGTLHRVWFPERSNRPAPRLLAQPADATVLAGAPAAFAVEARTDDVSDAGHLHHAGDGPEGAGLTYRWTVDGGPAAERRRAAVHAGRPGRRGAGAVRGGRRRGDGVEPGGAGDGRCPPGRRREGTSRFADGTPRRRAVPADGAGLEAACRGAGGRRRCRRTPRTIRPWARSGWRRGRTGWRSSAAGPSRPTAGPGSRAFPAFPSFLRFPPGLLKPAPRWPRRSSCRSGWRTCRRGCRSWGCSRTWRRWSRRPA